LGKYLTWLFGCWTEFQRLCHSTLKPLRPAPIKWPKASKSRHIDDCETAAINNRLKKLELFKQ